MDGMNLLPDSVADEWYRRISGLLADEWALVKQSKTPGLVLAHARLHYALADLAKAMGVPSGPTTMSGGGDKPPPPQ